MHNEVLARRLSIALLFSALTIAGCSNSGNPSYYQPPTNATPTPVGVTPTPTPSPTSSSPAASATVLYIANGSAGVGEYNALTGAAINASFAPPAANSSTVEVGVDDNGNVYEAVFNGSATTYQEVSPAGTVVATYTPTSANPEYLGVAPTGEVVISGYTTNGSTMATTDSFDEWNPGATGPAPSQTYTTAADTTVFALDANGNLYAPAFTTTAQTFEIFLAGQTSNTPSNIITDTQAPAENEYYPQAMSVAPNGTLVVGEDAFASPDPDEGIYEYANALNSSTGTQTFTATSASVIALDTDGSNNVYAALNNATSAGAANGSAYGADTAASIEEIPAGATSGTTFAGAPGVLALTAGTNGSVYLSQVGENFFANVTAAGNVYYLAPGSTTFNSTALIAGTNSGTLSLLYGNTAHNSYNGNARRKTFYASLGGSRSAHGSFARFIRRYHGMALRRMTTR